ncbi:MAG: TIGR00730 family Rossman fold protein [Xanthomonadales bacterium]|nr:TIGR00730 family Rossman fold protein [Xanthomonadales bacterium]NIX11983.1 TIGR00730 family Rossman fold protein [Xanthomonadales bacterium]
MDRPRTTSYYNIAFPDEPVGDGSMPNNSIKMVTVYAASSQDLAPKYYRAARRTGEVLAEAGLSVCFGGGGEGLMGAMADGALAGGAEVHGVVPEMLRGLELSHTGLTSLDVVSDMRVRKHRMLERSDAVVTLPGGCGTYEEVFEALTLKRLGEWLGPIVLVNTDGFYDLFIRFLEHSVRERFMGDEHANMWSVVSEPEEIIGAMRNAHEWSSDALQFANVTARPR